MTISVNNDIVTQTVRVDGVLATPLAKAGAELERVLIKRGVDGSSYVVPPCAIATYSSMLDREIEAAKGLIIKPSLAKNMLYVFFAIFVLFAWVGEWFDQNIWDCMAYSFGFIVGGVWHYVGANNKNDKKTEALTEIRGFLMEDYINYFNVGSTSAPVTPVATEEVVVPVAPVSIAKAEVHTPPEVPIKEEPIVASVEAPVFVQDSHNHPTSNIIVPDSKGSITISRGGLYVIIGLSVLVVLLVIALIGALVPDESVAVTPLQEQVVVLEDEVEDDDSVVFVEEPVESDVVVVSAPVPAPVKVKMTREQELNELLDSEDNNGTGAWADMSRERNTLKKQRENPEYDSSADPESSDYDPALFEDPEGMGWESE